MKWTVRLGGLKPGLSRSFVDHEVRFWALLWGTLKQALKNAPFQKWRSRSFESAGISFSRRQSVYKDALTSLIFLGPIWNAVLREKSKPVDFSRARFGTLRSRSMYVCMYVCYRTRL